MDPSESQCQTNRHIQFFYLPNDLFTFALGKPKSEMLQIEWKSSVSRSYAIPCLPFLDSEKLYHSDGRRRSRPKASTVHGWLVKWRATFSGNERLRKEGIREMREAKAVREWKRKKKAARQAKAKERGPQTSKGLSRISQHSSAKRPSRKGTRHLTSPTHSPKPTPANSRRSSHNRQGAGDRIPHSSRNASYNSRRDIVRTAEKKR
jgi:hypothetical protein